MDLNRLEAAVLKAMTQSTRDETGVLGAQLKGASVRARENTGAGFFTYFDVDRSCRQLQVSTMGDVWAKIRGFNDPMTFLLLVKDGYVDALEGAAIRDRTVDTDFSTVEFEILSDPYGNNSKLS
jgi:hypothetical protein